MAQMGFGVSGPTSFLELAIRNQVGERKQIRASLLKRHAIEQRAHETHLGALFRLELASDQMCQAMS